MSKVNIQIYEDAYRQLEKALDLPEPDAGKNAAGQLSEATSALGVNCAMHDPDQVIVVDQR